MTPENRDVDLANILLVEDNPSDVLLTQIAMKQCKLLNSLHVAEDGEEALAFLRHEGVHAGAPRPDIILLDLNLPRMDGRELLAIIKKDASFAHNSGDGAHHIGRRVGRCTKLRPPRQRLHYEAGRHEPLRTDREGHRRFLVRYCSSNQTWCRRELAKADQLRARGSAPVGLAVRWVGFRV
jgi:CheY-like chemotaxis protein